MQEKRCAITQSTSQAQSGSTPRPSNPLSFPFYPFLCATPCRVVACTYVCTIHFTELSRLATFAPFLFVRNTPATMIVRRKWNADSLVSQPGSFFRRGSSFQMRARNKRLARRNGSKEEALFVITPNTPSVFSSDLFQSGKESFFSRLFELGRK